MTDTEYDWLVTGTANGWTMPSAPRWKRLPIIRHVRALIEARRVDDWYETGPGALGAFRTGSDAWVVLGIWLGMERDPS